MNDLTVRTSHPAPAARLSTLPFLPFVEVVDAAALAKAESACGWFESSWDLRQGLAVSELPDSELALAALWFTALAGPVGTTSVQWQ